MRRPEAAHRTWPFTLPAAGLQCERTHRWTGPGISWKRFMLNCRILAAPPGGPASSPPSRPSRAAPSSGSLAAWPTKSLWELHFRVPDADLANAAGGTMGPGHDPQPERARQRPPGRRMVPDRQRKRTLGPDFRTELTRRPTPASYGRRVECCPDSARPAACRARPACLSRPSCHARTVSAVRARGSPGLDRRRHNGIT